MRNAVELSSRISKIAVDEPPAPHELDFNGKPLETALVPTPVNSPFSDGYQVPPHTCPSIKNQLHVWTDIAFLTSSSLLPSISLLSPRPFSRADRPTVTVHYYVICRPAARG